MAGSLTKEQIKTVLSEIWRAREMGDAYDEDLAFLSEKTQFPELEDHLEETLFQGDMPLEQVALRLSLYQPVKPRLSREELVEAVRRIMEVEGEEGELEELLDVVQANVPHPAVTDLIYWPPEGKDVTPEEVVERALAHSDN
ncbi:MAG: bacteriocin immunity protein [Planctomycetes bacterium]|nr:bacteriocin immunity protein [Planctomycetota bacterium]